VTRARAYAKLNLALVVGPVRPDGKHEVATVLQAIDLFDDIDLTSADALTVAGFPEDTLVRAALERLAEAAGVATKWRVLIEKRVPVAAGLGGGSSDAATALELANSSLAMPLPRDDLHALAAAVGADVPFFLREGPQLGTGDGADLAAVMLPTDYVVLLLLPEGASKDSTASVYRSFDERDGAAGFEERRSELLRRLEQVKCAQDLARLPRNDLASSPLQQELEALGALRADVTGAGPAVYALFDDSKVAEQAASALRRTGRTWLIHPVQRRMAR
jgi:4-diphosphocytidyl-2-C-methyl-D-erythritol kinase